MGLDELFAGSLDMVETYLKTWIPAPDRYPSRIHEAMHYSLFSGGKRVRPSLVFCTGRMFGVADETLLPAAAAVEVLHTYSLIHDDLPCMDDDELRRGKPTCHKVYGEAVAVLAGDALLTAAFGILSEGSRKAGIPPETACRLVERLCMAAGSLGLVGGQIVDMESEEKDIPLPVVQYIHSHKTGELIRFCTMVGPLVAGAAAEDIGRMERFGGELGLLFQVKDDLLDVEGSTRALGKTAGSDKRKSKATYPGVVGIDETRCILNTLRQRARDELSVYDDRAVELLKLVDFVATREH